MPIYEYRGLNRTGKNVKGVLDAENLRAARAKLKKDGIFVVDLKDKTKAAAKKSKGKSSTQGGSVTVNDIAMMTRQMATLIKANIPLVDTLSALSEQVENPSLAEALADCKNMVNEGSTFNKALSKYPKIFSKIYISMAEAGEAAGNLDVILMRLAEFTEAQNELRQKVKSALTYPIIMLIVTFGILMFMFVFIIPKMVAVFESAPELKLPWYSIMIIDFSGFLVNYWYLILGSMIGAFLLFSNWKKTESGKKQWDAISLRLPYAGPIVRMVAVARFTRTLGTLLLGGVPMLHALDIVRNVVDNNVIAMAIDDARGNISEGESIAGPMAKSGQFPPLVVHMVKVGEKTGDLENMLTKVSEAYDFQVKAKLDGVTSMMGPVVTVIMGMVIAVIVFAIMVPMFEMTNLAGK
ncbi:MAG: type II secretion system inner membrane protein GspF [Pseudobdellovibrionaceae bacterium]